MADASAAPSTHETPTPPTGVRSPRSHLASDAPRADLNGEWRFRLFDEAVTGVAADDPGTGDGWGSIAVPGHWQLQGHGSPAYTNVVFPFPVDPPRVPRDNPTGEYRRTFAVPSEWLDGGRVVLRFEGVDSWFAVAVNGTPLATSSGSRLPTEIDVTDVVVAGENLLAVRVHQWSAASYVEDQDQWWLSGIFRDVALLRRPAGGITDVRVAAEYDPTSGQGTFRAEVTTLGEARVRIPELGIDLASGQEATLAVEPWSAEVPRLYDTEVSTDAETVRLRVGFRTVTIDDGVFRVNGAAVKLRGVNRHEFEPTRGRAVTPETMLEDVVLAKRHHVNAVRTSHYPPHPHFLDLCDEYGLYVIDENDLETHGFGVIDWRGNPTDDAAWEPLLVDRVRRMIGRDAHHPSIVMWSLGNEAGEGRNLAAMAAAIRELDDSRPIHYEGDRSSADVDVYSRMYASVGETERIGRGEEDQLTDGELDARRRGLPFVQCEYAHAMGNGPGGLADYDELFDTYPRLMGGFVWEWIDHGIATRTPDGVEFFGYGGDFGEEIHDGTFIADGMLLPDRTPSPGMVEMAAVYAPVRIDVEPDAGVPALLVRNRYAFRSTEHAQLTWALEADGEVLASGDYDDLGVLEAGEAFLLTELPAEASAALETAPAGPAVWWTVRARLRPDVAIDAPWAEEGFGLGAGQVLVRAAAPLPAAVGGEVRASDDGGYAVGPAAFDGAGRLVRLGGAEVTLARVDAWRAPTDNDRAASWGEAMSDAEAWRRSGLDRVHERLDSVEVDGDALVVTARTAGAATDCGFAVTYRWTPAGDDAVDLELDIVPEGEWPGSLARIGMLLGLAEGAPSDVLVDWVGLGPGESYADSKVAALTGRWQHTVADLQTRYTHPQENGARRGVTRADLVLGAGRLRVESDGVSVGGRASTGLELSARPWTDAALAAAAHPHDLVAGDVLWLHLDAAQHGLGSAACGPGVLPNAVLRPAPAQLRLRFTAVR
ncbi:glycoside hydrolase family 2 TIM barrel [Beutenbergia cavernae DSM 12333]|uniref:beta-galactosidase n=1 Tax=Beutenbergia cavernae (strain ATCC BAA-8 / DSM 12333 / CCUG 43141 / JCM 11478 / NBRC 16432 / NCIMB 13614 / HKI 0122) TaxID=471853 RepID=C5C1Z6_BEUC1|nr:glycoside hydrolase family 2 TIM barrel-domain containing protein [Beutenbergia cavernae]ACQ81621.1 glycoside hydrolase family 2 TIM barrel [Beutenbergia cavernae DSM 12333]